MVHLVPVLIAAYLVLRIRWCVQIGAPGPVGAHAGPEAVRHSSGDGVIGSIWRAASLGKDCFDNKPAPAEWTLAVAIPKAALKLPADCDWATAGIKVLPRPPASCAGWKKDIQHRGICCARPPTLRCGTPGIPIRVACPCGAVMPL